MLFYSTTGWMMWNILLSALLTGEAAVLHDGWYVTGDIGMMDGDGFLKVTGRLSRFSKIGGEMVPHGRVEEALNQAIGADSQGFAVTAVADPRKGERLVVLTTLDDKRVQQALEKLASSGLPNLFIPRRDDFIKVEAVAETAGATSVIQSREPTCASRSAPHEPGS